MRTHDPMRSFRVIVARVGVGHFGLSDDGLDTNTKLIFTRQSLINEGLRKQVVL